MVNLTIIKKIKGRFKKTTAQKPTIGQLKIKVYE
jgi:hypothetical protein